MSYHKGFSARLRYDPCAYNKDLSESVAPFAYQLYDGKYENCNRCVYTHYTRPFDGDIIDVDSDLKNISRPASNCPSRKYNPRCKRSPNCISTYDSHVPVVLAPEVCPIVFNNLTWGNDTGIRHPRPANCKGFSVAKANKNNKKK